MQALRDLAGKDERNAPCTQAWMRETEAESFPWWPRCGNFAFYLYAGTAHEPGVGSSCSGPGALSTDGQAMAVTDLDATSAPGNCPNDRVYSASCGPRSR